MKQLWKRLAQGIHWQNHYVMAFFAVLGSVLGVIAYDINPWILGVLIFFPLGVIPLLLGMFTSFFFSALLYLVVEQHQTWGDPALALWSGMPVRMAVSLPAIFIFWQYYRRFLQKNLMEKQRDFIFFDHTNVRLTLFHLCKWVVMPLFLLSCLLLGMSLLAGGSHLAPFHWPFSQLDESRVRPLTVTKTAFDPASVETGKNQNWQGWETPLQHGSAKQFFAFYLQHSGLSRSHLLENIPNMHVVVPDWYFLESNGRVVTSVQTEIDEMLKRNRIKIMPSIHNIRNGKWDPDAVHRLLISDIARKDLIRQLRVDAKNNGYWGINVNFTDLYPTDREALTSFIQELVKAFHHEGLYVTQNVPVMPGEDTAYDHAILAEWLDYIVLVIPEEHSNLTEAGPIASFAWTKSWLETIATPLEKTIIGLNAYGYDWNITRKGEAIQLAFSQVIEFAERHGLQVQWDPVSRNPYVAYKENQKERVIWFADSTVFFNEIKMAWDRGVAGAALLQMGLEDPNIWKFTKDIGQIADHSPLLNTDQKNISYNRKNVWLDEQEFVRHINASFTSRQYKWDEMLRTLENNSAENTILFFAFYAPGRENDKRSLKQNIDHFDVLIPGWYSLDASGNLVIGKEEATDAWVRSNGKGIMPLIHNYVNGEWSSDAVHRMISNTRQRTRLIEQLHQDIMANGYIGINFDFENIKEDDKEHWSAFIKEVSAKFHRSGLLVTQDVAVFDKAFDYPVLAEYEDYFFYMLYDEHNLATMSSAVASSEWIYRMLATMDLPPEQTIVCIGNYGYDWSRSTEQAGQVLSYDEAMSLAASHGIPIKWDVVSCNPFFQYEKDGIGHEVWFLDSATFYNTARMAAAKGTAGIALWRVGSEDPAVWQAMRDLKQGSPAQGVETIPIPEQPVIEPGNIVKEAIAGKFGKRVLKTTGREFIYDVEYLPPVPFQLKMIQNQDEKIVLAFEGGPDPKMTSAILDMLKVHKIRAAFFLTGKNTLQYPGLVKRIYKEGHELGILSSANGKFTDGPDKWKLERVLTQYLIETITGHRTHFYQLPDTVGDHVNNEAVWTLLQALQAEGYIMVDNTFNPARVMDEMNKAIILPAEEDLKYRKVLTLPGIYEEHHDYMGAFAGIMNELQRLGYQYVSLSDMLQVSRGEVMPPQIAHMRLIQTFGGSLVFLYAFASSIFQIAGPAAILLGILRLFIFLLLALKHKKSQKQLTFDDTYRPSVSVLIAAYNEEVVIGNTLVHLLNSSYTDFEILVVDDGSTDDTYEFIRNTFGDEPRIKLFQQTNQGKIAALNYALEKASGEIVITVDADTLVTKDSMKYLVRHFQDSKVAAVAGNIKVTNRNRIVALFQHIEFVYSFNLERRAYSAIHANIVVPGCNGAWRKSYLMEAGKFSTDTIAEDTDVPIAFLENGYKVIYEEKALAFTEAPDTVRDLHRQRVRWYFGILQVLWKNKKLLVKARNKWVQFVTLTNSWLYGVLYQLIVPAIDIMILWQLLSGTSHRIVFLYCLLIILDLGATVFAFRLERESLRPLVWVIPMKIFYRYFMFLMIVLSLINAFKGKPLNWNKLKRLGAINVQTSI